MATRDAGLGKLICPWLSPSRSLDAIGRLGEAALVVSTTGYTLACVRRVQPTCAHVQTTEAQRVWVANIIDLPVKHGMLYLAIVPDLFVRCVVGRAIADHMRTELPLAALDMVMGERGPVVSTLRPRQSVCQPSLPRRAEEARYHSPSISVDSVGTTRWSRASAVH